MEIAFESGSFYDDEEKKEDESGSKGKREIKIGKRKKEMRRTENEEWGNRMRTKEGTRK